MTGEADKETERAQEVLACHYELILKLEDAEGDEIKTLDAVIKFLRETGVHPRLRISLLVRYGRIVDEEIKRIRREAGLSGSERPVGQTSLLIDCAVAVTMLKKAGSTVPNAARIVACLSGVDQKKLINFRDNLNRGLQSDFARLEYEDRLRRLSAMPKIKISKTLISKLFAGHAFVSNMSKSNTS